jgi:hypothetical protein
MRRIITVSVCILLLAGCGGSSGKSVLEGKITYKGEPVNNATLMLYPTNSKEPNPEPINITVTQEGTFKSADIPAGEYKVVVSGQSSSGDAAKMMKGMPADKKAENEQKFQAAYGAGKATINFPNKYRDPTKTDLKVTVPGDKKPVELVMNDNP